MPDFFTLSLPSPLDLPALHACRKEIFPALLQSSGNTGWDILFALPRTTMRYDYSQAQQFLADLAALPQHAIQSAPFPFTGGWCLYAGYELLEAFEPSVPARDTGSFPLAALIRCPAAVLYERASGKTTLLAETQQELAALALAIRPPQWQAAPLKVEAITEDDPASFLAGVERCKQYIYEGDVFQVNLSRAWDIELSPGNDANDLYARLRQANPAPFSALFDLGAQQIVCSSPERLVEVRDQQLRTRPIAGTHPRSPDPEQDQILKQQLLDTAKERAEHIMLVDLERNDLGRIAQPGSVKVSELMAVTTYAFVHHIESTVCAQLRTGLHTGHILRALFPGGTITGCPKVRCMQIIREIEDRARLAYTGSLGYLNRDGSLDLNILIRSFMQEGKHLYFRTGAGIVADSNPERELQETRHKARGLLRALGVAD